MNNCQKIMVTSCKGGVGKSTVSANLGIRLAYDGFKTLIIDCDFGVRSLDLIMGLEDRVVFDIVDVIMRDIPIESAAVRDPRSDNLFFVAAPYNYNDELTCEVFSAAIDKIAESMELDYIIIDTPGDTGIPFRLAASASDMALIVSTYQPISIRAAERTAILLSELGVDSRRLIINCFDPDSKGIDALPGLTEIIDKTSIRLLGIIPYDEQLAAKQADGLDVFTIKKSDAAQSFVNIVGRLNGKNIPVFTGFRNLNRIKTLKKIQ
ncbi:MAG: P-loop NTPase [Firmicutes bacterium]|nr:P-loop NTPase [Candidatus Colimorpha enterica]